MPTSEINLGGLGGGPGRAVTRELLRHGGGLGRKAARAVGGRVGKIDFNGGNGRLKKKGCQLDRDEVQRVVNRHIGAVQQCYERELLKQSGLSGKIRIEWTIRANGTAKNVRQVFSSMSSTAVSRCIMEEIRTWRFLPSSCGEVTVGYPFLFESLRF